MIKTKNIPKFTFKIKTTKKQLLGIYIFIIQRIIEKSSKIIREMICLQHFYNIFTTNLKWQVVTSCYCWDKKAILALV